MAGTISEKMLSREYVAGENAKLLYVVTGLVEEDEVYTLAAGTSGAPSEFNGLLRKSIRVEPVSVDSVTGGGLWDVEVDYVASASDLPSFENQYDSVGDVELSYDTGSASTHITRAIARTDSGAQSADEKTKYDNAFGLSIGVSSDKTTVEGVDINIPAFEFQAKKIYNISGTTTGAPSIETIAGLAWKTNNASFTVTDTVTSRTITCAAGECLFMGASESRFSTSAIAISFRFLKSPNQTDVSINDFTVDKGGHEYLWVFYKPADVGGVKVATAKYAASMQVYQSGDFSGLNL